jgi:hypothetical protein
METQMVSHDDNGARAMPTPRRIEIETRRIRAGWSSRDYQKRATADPLSLPVPWTIPEIADTNTARRGVTCKSNANVDERD